MSYRETSQQQVFCPECDESISAEEYSPYNEMCDNCWENKQKDELKITESGEDNVG